MSKDKKYKGDKKGKKWSALDEVRHPIPPAGFAFKNRKKSLKDEEDLNEMKRYR